MFVDFFSRKKSACVFEFFSIKERDKNGATNITVPASDARRTLHSANVGFHRANL